MDYSNLDLKFSNENAKTKKLRESSELVDNFLQDKRKIYSLDLLSGWTCPFASECSSKVVEIGGLSESGNAKVKVKDGANTKFRCFSASQEALMPTVYNRRKANTDAIQSVKTAEEMAGILQSKLPKNVGIVRIHVAGDMFNEEYFKAWLLLAQANPTVLFYAYTKSLRYWVNNMELVNSIPNIVLTASRGGREDHLIDTHNLREAVVVFSQAEADAKGLEIDSNDTHAAEPSKRNQSFALLIHGTQPKGSEASKALQVLKAGAK